MKKHDIKKFIRREITSHVPSHAPKINWNDVDEKRQLEVSQSPRIQGKKTYSFRFGLALTILLLGGFIWMMIGLLDQTPTRPSGQDIFIQEQHVLPVSFVSTASLLSSQPLELSSETILLSSIQSPTEAITTYLGMIEVLLSPSGFPLVDVKASTREGYETEVHIQAVDMLGKPISYQLYYNVTDYQEKKDEVTYTIEGLMMIGQQQYMMIGTKEVEDDEEKIIVRAKVDESNYIESIYETEDNESFYRIRVVKSGQVESESTLKIEYEDDELKIKVIIEHADFSAEYELKYEIEDLLGIIKVEYELNNHIDQTKTSGEMRITVLVDELTQSPIYRFHVISDEGEYEEDRERSLKNDDDDDEDDDDNEDDEDDEEDDKDQEQEEDEIDDDLIEPDDDDQEEDERD